MPEIRLYSIGHSNHSLDHFMHLLDRARVTAVADVRSQPFSQWLPHFNRPELERELRLRGVGYAFAGHQLGGRPAQVNVYNGEGQVDYERVRATAEFQEGLDALCAAGEQDTVAMLCSEEDPLNCHRGLMIAPALVERGILPAHVRGDGTIESTVEFEERLLRETGVGTGILDGLFASMLSGSERSELLAEAYRVQARRRAFRLRPELARGAESGD
ncbi:MAG TPA: DUF488 domain-containing protein [Gemmataceae bacterium]|nr:DUF488 domain-containing protein [Gemmataceae bacterium]